MNRLLYLIFAGLFISSVSFSGEALYLTQAVQLNKLSVKAVASNGYSGVKVVLKNKTNKALSVDTFGSVFVPAKGHTQRLGVARVSLANAQTTLTLKAKGQTEVTFPAFCLDHSRGGPGQGAAYLLSKGLVPRKIQEVLSYWNANTSLGQSLVQGSVWSGNVAKLKGYNKKIKHNFEKLVREGIVVVKSKVHVLTKDGNLNLFTKKVSNNERQPLRKKVCRIFYCGQRLVVVRLTEDGNFRAEKFERNRFETIMDLPFLPDHAMALRNGKYVFSEREWLYLPDRMVVRFKGKILRLEESENPIRKECWALIDTGRLYRLHLDTGKPVSFDVTYQDISSGRGLTTFVQDKTLKIHEGIRRWNPIKLEWTYERMLIRGKQAVLLANQELWTLKNRALVKVAQLEGSPVDLALDGTKARAYALMEGGVVKEFALNK